MNAKKKGSGYEREICVKLSLWVSDGTSTELFSRSAGSGSHATYKKKQGKQASQTGDITSVDSKGTSLTDKYFIECKFYRDLQLPSLIYGTPKNGTILEFWSKAKEDATYFGKGPIIIARQNNKRDLIGIDSTTKTRLKESNYIIQPLASFPQLNLHLYDMSLFFTMVDPKIFVSF